MNTEHKPYRVPLLAASLLTLGIGPTILAAISVYAFGRDDSTKGVFARICFVWTAIWAAVETYRAIFGGVGDLQGHVVVTLVSATVTLLIYGVVSALFVGIASLFRSGQRSISGTDGA